MKKGFTLLEMVAVLIIMAIISYFALPNLLENVKNKEQSVSDDSKKILYAAANKYISSYPSNYPTIFENSFCITLEQLVNEGELSLPILDIKTGNSISLNTTIKVDINKFGDKKYQILESGVECVGNNQEIVAEKIYILGNDYVKVGGTLNLTTLISPQNTSNKKISWTSSDESVATVSDTGVVEGIKVGKTIIKVTTSNNLEASLEIEVKYYDEILNGSDPVLKDEMIPVEISDTGEVTYADIGEKWYDYENKIWANAVILKNKPSKTYSVGNIILESDIESYFVWIPKYSYKIFDLGNYDSLTTEMANNQEIQIKFGLMNTTDEKISECATPLTSGSNGNCTVDKYMTHPAFSKLGAKGIWVGKFETGYKNSSSASGAIKNSNDSSYIQIKPNTYSWRGNTVANIFKISKDYKTNLDSHMMKNTEWGAVAYLSHSKYGINTEITINNCSNYITGIGADTVSASSSSSTCGTAVNKWNGENGILASTTGNISGIYDMSGGSYEYMASYLNGNLGSSDITNEIINSNENYFDKYSSSNFNYRILGDSVGEMGPFANNKSSWYSDSANLINSSNPWFLRGGLYSSLENSGIFAFDKSDGNASDNISFRIVLGI